MTIQEFIDRNNITMTTARLLARTDGISINNEGTHWQCRIEYDGRHFVTEFTAGPGHSLDWARKNISRVPEKHHAALNNPFAVGRFNVAAREAQAWADSNWPGPSVADVLGCLQRDIVCDTDFENWCSDYGYDVDSRQAERTFDACVKATRNLQELFDDGEMFETFYQLEGE